MTNYNPEKTFRIPATIESCNGSLHSESLNDANSFHDDTEGGLLSVSMPNQNEEEKERESTFKREKQFDKKWRGIVTLMLLGNALLITGSTYAFLAAQEKKDFETSFERYAQAIVDACHIKASSVAVTFQGVSDSITSFVQDTDAQWPFVTITDWEIQSKHAREASFTELVGFVPLIPNTRRMEQWQEYAQQNQHWLDESRLTAAKMNPDTERLQAKADEATNNINDRALQENKRGPFAPVWQLSPPPKHDAVLGYDLLSHPSMERLLFAMYESNFVAISAVMDVSFLTGDAPLEPSNEDNAKMEEDSVAPRSVLFQPVYDQHNFNNENPAIEVPKLQGVYMGVLSWESYFSDLLPENVHGIYCVVSNDCGQQFTFLINGRETEYLGLGDYHEPKYDANMVSVSFDEFQKPGTETNATLQNEDQFQCHYTLSIFPSVSLQEDLETSRPFFFTTIVGLIFCATFIVLIVYLKVVQYRTKQVEKVAKASDKILTTLYPENVKKELMRDAQAEEDKKKAFVSSSLDTPKTNASPLVNEFLAAGGGDEEALQMTATTHSGDGGSTGSSFVGGPVYRSKPIANLFEATTIFFADIVGFTKWSSTRTPTEVFELLESIYGCFDQLAKKRQVYKVETIGDCYVAVTGLPKPNKRHALVMARFAQDCLIHIGKVTKSLESTLGTDTSELTMRIGLHSGPVTAGVLRGERSRFQLFGDTVNTAARMESHGRPKCIHVSEATAELLRSHGRGSWLRKREDLVDAKGKGKMQTYYAVATSAAQSEVSTSSNSGGHTSQTFHGEGDMSLGFGKNHEAGGRMLGDEISTTDETSLGP